MEVVVTDSYARVESHEAVEAEFLRSPDVVAKAIKLAMELSRQAPPVQMMMMANGVPTMPGKQF
jgi:hypothetical protein